MISTLNKIGEGVFGEAIVPNTRGAAKVATKEQDTLVSKEALDYQIGLSSKGTANKRVACSFTF